VDKIIKRMKRENKKSILGYDDKKFRHEDNKNFFSRGI